MNRKLTAARVLVIRQHEANIKHEALAAYYGVSRRAISYVLAGMTWRWCWTLPPRFNPPERSTP